MTRLCDVLGIPLGMTAVVGGGGKTSLIARLARELSENARVLCLTTTHISPPDGVVLRSPSPAGLQAAFQRTGVVTAGEPLPDGRLGPPFGRRLEALASEADFTLIEADGSRGLPVKAPEAFEPVLSGGEALVIAVAGMTAASGKIAEVAHRSERYAALLGKSVNDPVTPGDIARVLMSGEGQRKDVRRRFAVVLNQCDTPELLAAGRACAALLPDIPCVLAALQARPELCEAWRNGTCLC